MKSKNLVLGIIKGYDFENIEPFIVSLLNTGYDGDVVLFFSDTDEVTLNLLRQYNIELIPFHDTFPYIDVDTTLLDNLQIKNNSSKNNIMPVNTYRYIIWYIYLFMNKKKYNAVMLTDTKDVLFQSDPFDFNFNNELCCFVEDTSVVIKECPYNSNWILNVFGDKLLNEIGSYNPTCCGVTIGSSEKVFEYLKKMTAVFNRIKVYRYGDDTAVHNYLIYKGKIRNSKLFINEDGPVLTMANKHKKSIRFNRKKQVVNKKGNIVNILHQYDRYFRVIKSVYKNSKIKIDKEKMKKVKERLVNHYFWGLGYDFYLKNKNYKKARECLFEGLHYQPFNKVMWEIYIKSLFKNNGSD